MTGILTKLGNLLIEVVEAEVARVIEQLVLQELHQEIRYFSLTVVSQKGRLSIATINFPAKTCSTHKKWAHKNSESLKASATAALVPHRTWHPGMTKTSMQQETTWPTTNSKTNQSGQLCSMLLKICSIWMLFLPIKHKSWMMTRQRDCRKCEDAHHRPETASTEGWPVDLQLEILDHRRAAESKEGSASCRMPSSSWPEWIGTRPGMIETKDLRKPSVVPGKIKHNHSKLEPLENHSTEEPAQDWANLWTTARRKSRIGRLRTNPTSRRATASLA